MLGALVLGAILVTTNALVCIPELCESITDEPLNCVGGVIKAGGFCGCTDACAKIEGEVCQATPRFGMIPAGTCDTGLDCHSQENMAFGRGKCVKRQAKRDTQTRCQQMRITAMVTMVIYPGKWTAKCDADGNFQPMQCDMSGHCFCVNADGDVQGNRVKGHLSCPAIQ